jgi:hypothetical protein
MLEAVVAAVTVLNQELLEEAQVAAAEAQEIIQIRTGTIDNFNQAILATDNQELVEVAAQVVITAAFRMVTAVKVDQV